MPGTLYIDSAPFIGGAQLSLLDELRRDSGVVQLLAGWPNKGAVGFQRLSTHHWPASLAGCALLIQDALLNRRIIQQAWQQMHPETVYLNTVRSAVLCALAGCRFNGSRVVIRDRDIRMPRYVPRLLRYWRPFEVWAISESVAAKWHGIPVTVKENQLDEKSIRLTLPFQYPFDGTVVLQVADFVPWKRHDLFLKAIAEARQANPQIFGCIKGRVHSKGDAAWLKQILELRAKLMLDDYVMIDTQEVSALPYIAGADMLVSCSKNEPWGRAIREAQILGKKTIVIE